MADRELNINLRFVKEQAERAAREFHEGEQQRIREDGEAQASFLKKWTVGFRKMQEAHIKYKQELKEESAEEERSLVRAVKSGLRAKKQLDDADAKYAQAQRLRREKEAKERREGLRAWARQHEVELANVIQGYKTFEKTIKKSLSNPFNAGRLSIEKFRKEAIDSLNSIKIDPKVARGLSEQVEREGKLLAKATKRLNASINREIMTMGSERFRAMEQNWEEFNLKLKGLLEQEVASQREAKKRMKEEAKQEAEDEAEYARWSAEQRMAYYVNEAKEKSLRARAATEDAVKFAKLASEAQKRGDKEAADNYKKLAEQRAEQARELAETTVRYAQRATREQNAATKGQSDASVQAARTIVESVRDTAAETTKSAREGEREVKNSFKGQTGAARENRQEVEKNTKAVSSLAKQYMLTRVGERVFRKINEAIRDTIRSTEEAGRHIEGMFDRFERLRESLTENIRMSGQEPSPKVTADVAERLAGMGVSVEAGVSGLSSFEAQGASSIGEGKEYRMSRKEADEFLEFAIPHAASIGLTGARGQRAAQMVAATLMQTAPLEANGKVDLKKLKLAYARSLRTVQRAVGNNEEAAEQYAGTMRMHAFEAKNDKERERLDLIFAGMSEVTVNGERVATDALFRELRQIKETDERYEQLGFKGGMSMMERLDSAYAAIQKMAKAENKSVEEVAARYFDREHGFRSFIGYRKMLETGADRRALRERNEVTLPGALQQNQQYKQTGAARLASERARGVALEARQVQEKGMEEFEIFRQQVRNKFISAAPEQEGEGFWDAWTSGRAQELGLGNRAEYALHQHVGAELKEQLEALAAQGDENAAQFLAQEGHKLQASLTYLFADRAAQMRAAARVRMSNEEATAREKATGFRFPTNLAVQQAVEARALSDLQRSNRVGGGDTAASLKEAAKIEARLQAQAGFSEFPQYGAHGPAQSRLAEYESHYNETLAALRERHGNNNEAILAELHGEATPKGAKRRPLRIVLPHSIQASRHGRRLGSGHGRHGLGHENDHASRMRGSRYIVIQTEADKKRAAQWAANTRALRAASIWDRNRIQADRERELEPYREAARRAQWDADMDRHVNARYLADRHAATVFHPRPYQAPRYPASWDSQMDRAASKLERAATLMGAGAAVPAALPGRPHVQRN